MNKFNEIASQYLKEGSLEDWHNQKMKEESSSNAIYVLVVSKDAGDTILGVYTSKPAALKAEEEYKALGSPDADEVMVVAVKPDQSPSPYSTNPA